MFVTICTILDFVVMVMVKCYYHDIRIIELRKRVMNISILEIKILCKGLYLLIHQFVKLNNVMSILSFVFCNLHADDEKYIRVL